MNTKMLHFGNAYRFQSIGPDPGAARVIASEFVKTCQEKGIATQTIHWPNKELFWAESLAQYDQNKPAGHEGGSLHISQEGVISYPPKYHTDTFVFTDMHDHDALTFQTVNEKLQLTPDGSIGAKLNGESTIPLSEAVEQFNQLLKKARPVEIFQVSDGIPPLPETSRMERLLQAVSSSYQAAVEFFAQ